MCLFCTDVCGICKHHYICKECNGTFDSLESGYCDDCYKRLACVNCGEINNPNEFDGETWCEDCFDETFTYCDDCSEIIRQDDIIKLGDEFVCEDCARPYACALCGDHTKDGFYGNDEYYCESCFDRLFIYCESCHDPVSIDDSTEIGYSSYCESCRDEQFFYCENCYEWIDYDYYGRDGVCQECDDSCSAPGYPIKGKRTDRIGSLRQFGVEIETSDGDWGDRPDEWGCVEDGSISGMELVSPIMSGDEGIESVEECYRRVHPSFDSNCGIHVHINVGDLTDSEKLKVLHGFHRTKDMWFSRVDPERWDNSYCDDDMPEEWNNYDDFMVKVGHRRYFWCNPSSIHKHGTIEIRLMEGTDDVDKVVNWIIDLVDFVDEIVKVERVA